MDIYSKNQNYTLLHGNMLDMTENIRPCTIDAIVTDPPYELNFMNKQWDNTGIAFRKETWAKCLEVLKPGGYLLAFGGSRTFHRIACAIEDAGFEIRDTIMWIYGSGFPKSMNIGLAIDKKNGVQSKVIGEKNVPDIRSGNYENNDGSRLMVQEKEALNKWSGWGTALKPAFEPIIVARKPCEGTCVDNVLKYDVGGINIDECRIENICCEDLGRNCHVKPFGGITINESTTPPQDDRGRFGGRFPSNVILTYDETDYEEVCGSLPVSNKPNGSIRNQNLNSSLGKNGIYGHYSEKQPLFEAYDDSGSAARYFYCAKTSKRDRDEGLENFDDKMIAFSNQAQAEAKRGSVLKKGGLNDVKIRKNIHPTVKPTKLMQYLVRLVTPNGGTVLDPFNGSGSTGKAVMYENKDHNKKYKYIGIELSEEYLEISKARIDFAIQDVCEITEDTNVKQISIFDFLEG